jgi:hypothetical protein
MIGLLLALASLAGEDPAKALARADALAALARAADEASRPKAVDEALRAYAALLESRPKDPETVPRARRRRAGLFLLLGHGREALAEHDAILRGPSARGDRARALVEGAAILAREGDFAAVEKRCRRAVEEYADERTWAAQAALERGRALVRLGRPREAEESFRLVHGRFGDEAKEAIASFDALALLLLSRGDPDRARALLRDCFERYAKEASGDGRRARYLSRLLGEMKAPSALAEPPPPK